MKIYELNERGVLQSEYVAKVLLFFEICKFFSSFIW